MASKIRYGGFEVKDECQICGYKGNTEVHHIISQARAKRLKEGDHNFDNDLVHNLANMIELCKKCHDQTDSSFYRRFMIDVEKGLEKAPKKRQRRRRKGKSKPRYKFVQCSFIKENGKRCGQRNAKIPEGGFCFYHRDDAPENHPQYTPPAYQANPPPRLFDEGVLEDYQIAELEFLRDTGYKPHEGHLRMFEEWSEAWKRRWLYGEKW